MVRIIPWNLPPVNGGSVGGYTPAPTPVTPSNLPYDLTDMLCSVDVVEYQRTYNANNHYTMALPEFTISGVNILDATSVSNITATVTLSAGDYVFSMNGTTTTITTTESLELSVDITQLMTSAGGSIKISNSIADNLGVNFPCIVVDGVKVFMRSGSPSSPYLFVSTTATVTLDGFKVYNSNGVVLQEWTP